MIIRTYQRRNRASDLLRGDSSSQESFWSSSQESAWSSSQEAAFVPSSQELSNWSALEIDESKPKKRKQDGVFQGMEGGKPGASKQLNSLQRRVVTRRWGFSAPPNSTLMEAQESGEMMEQVDEVNFAMDGLREGQLVQVQQASLLSILSLCASLQQRRFLRSHGIAKTLLDAVVALPTSDPELALAASAVFYLLASDGHDANMMDSDSCIGFLLKIIMDQSNTIIEGNNIVAKVHEKLRAVKNPTDAITADHLTAKSLALRALEKACLSAVVLDDSSGTVTKVGGQVKERLREMNGLDAVCNVAATCLTNLMKERNQQDVSLLLRCLRVMENVTFLSEDNQAYLLRLRHCTISPLLPESFIGIVIKIIDTLQELARQDDSKNMSDRKGDAVVSEVPSTKDTSTCADDKFQKEKKTRKGRDAAKPTNHKEMKLRNALQKAKILNSQRKVSLTSNCQKMIQVKVCDNDRRFKNPNEISTTSQETVFSQDPYDFDEMDIDVPFGKPKHQVKPKKAESSPPETLKATAQPDTSSLEEECLLSAVKVLMNLTNDNATGCKQVGACNGIVSVASLLVSNYPRDSQEESLDLLVTVLGMLVNLVEKDLTNRSQLATLDVPLPAHIKNCEASPHGRGILTLLCSLFLSKKGSGEAAEAREGSIIKLEEDDSVKRGQREAENMIVEAYTALLLAFLSTESDGARQAIAERLPAGGLLSLVPVLERFVAFHLSLNMISAEAHAAVQEVIKSLRQPAID